jgi:hypothetical protein
LGVVLRGDILFGGLFLGGRWVVLVGVGSVWTLVGVSWC